MIDDFADRFPTIWYACLRADLDPTADWLPVAPAAHYLSGGVVDRPRRRDDAPAPVGLRRDRVQRRARREPARVELAARRSRVRPARGRGDRRGQGRGRVDGRDDRRARPAPADRRSRRPIPSCCRKERATDPDAVRGAVQRAMSPTAASCATPTACSSRRDARPTSSALADDLPGPQIASYEVHQPAARVARDRRVARRSATESRGSHTRARLPGPVRRAGSAGSCRAATRRRVFVALPGVVARGRTMTRLRSARGSVVAGRRGGALAEDLGLLGDITSIACIDEDQQRRGDRSSPARRVCSRAPRSRPRPSARSTRRRACSGSSHDGDAVEAGAEIGEVAGPLRSILTGERVALNFLCHCSGVATLDAPLRARRARQGPDPRHAQDAARPARGPARGGARRRRLQPPRLAVDRGADQGQPPRRARAHEGGRAGARRAGRAGSIEVECDTLDQVVEARDAGRRRGAARQHEPRRRSAKAVDDARGRGQGRGVGRRRRSTRSARTPRPAPTSSPSARSRTRCRCSTSGSTFAEEPRRCC